MAQLSLRWSANTPPQKPARHVCGGQFDEQDVLRPPKPPVRHGLPPGRGPHTSAEVIAALKAEGVIDVGSVPVAAPLRQPHQPSAATMAALANFFRIKPAYFTDDEYYEKLDKELTWLANMRDEGVRRIAARTVGLSVRPSRTSPRRSMSCVAGSTWTISRRTPHCGVWRIWKFGRSEPSTLLEIASWRYCCAISRIHSRSEYVGGLAQPAKSRGRWRADVLGASSPPS